MLIGEEGREAYNSLIERKGVPAATILQQIDTDEFELMNAKTLPRRLIGGGANIQPLTLAKDNAQEAVIQQRLASRPMTLPTRGAAQRVRKAELAATLGGKQNDENCNTIVGETEAAEPCESPSYVMQNSYRFPEPGQSHSNGNGNANPIPLPPREGKKQVKANAKRHVRKHPLIIPANGVQRTLSKLADFSEETATTVAATTTTTPTSRTTCSLAQQQQRQGQSTSRALEVVAAVRANSLLQPEVSYENMPAVAVAAKEAAHTYQNLEKRMPADAAGLTDTASLQFESIMEADSHGEGVLQSPDVTDGFYNFSIQKEHFSKRNDRLTPTTTTELNVNDDELRNLDVEASRKLAIETDELPPLDAVAVDSLEPECSRRYSSVDNELAGNALFKKVRASVNMAMSRVANETVCTSISVPTTPTTLSTSMGSKAAAAAAVATGVQKPQTEAEYFAATAARLADSNSVSCEDLLEFSDKKPKGCERGVDSDEVRIMVKVLGKDSTPTRCLGALEFINWDVHKSIKLIKLQNILADANLTLSQCFEALHQQEWDLHTTALKMKGIKP